MDVFLPVVVDGQRSSEVQVPHNSNFCLCLYLCLALYSCLYLNLDLYFFMMIFLFAFVCEFDDDYFKEVLRLELVVN